MPGAAAAASAISLKLPYAKGQSFVVVQGYDTPPTHIKKDEYALDFSQNGCDAYGKAVVAAAPGTVMFMSQEGYNGGYGTELIIDHGGGIVSRYAHMIPDTITLAPGGAVTRGEVVGLIGDTGLVAGAACPAHPGTHLHFAVDTVALDGTFIAYKPEPISGYVGMAAGKWYLSDNSEDDDADGAASPPADGASAQIGGMALGTSTTATGTTATSTSAISIITSAATSGVISSSSSFASAAPFPLPTGGVSVIPPPASAAVITSSAAASATSSASSSAAPSETILFSQDDMSADSTPSWYEDNWYDLGNGFAGTLTSLMLYGEVSDALYGNSSVALEAFKDSGYTALVQTFDISDGAPFTDMPATATFAGLSIPLKPYFYYRLSTNQAEQNRSVILAGTASTSMGVMMWNNFIYGTGRVESTSTFFPFMVMTGFTPTSTLVPPPLTAPTDLSTTFDGLAMQLSISFGTSTDPDWPGNPLHYEMNHSTSGILSDDGWTAPGPIPLAIGNSYLIGVRARDDYGDVSTPATTTWNFPAGFAPYTLSAGLSSAYQYFTVPTTTTLGSIELFTANFGTNAANPYAVNCSLQLFDEYDLSSESMTPADNGFSGYGCAGDLVYSFASSSPALYPGHRYHWVFAASTGNPLSGGSVQFYGTLINTAGGLFGDPSLINAKFTLTAADGSTIFSN